MSASSPRTLVLFADDNDLVRELMVEMLSSRMPDLMAAQARDGADAVRRAWELRPHVVVMDVKMPGMDGLDATRCLKNHGATARIPVIAVTGVDYSCEQALAAGCDGYIPKPISPEQLFNEVCRVLGRTQPPVAQATS